MSAKLFISYNNTADGLSARVRDKIISLLESRNFETYPASLEGDVILVDVQLRAGDYWRPRLYEWLEEADLGLILCCAFQPDGSLPTDKVEHFRKVKTWLFHEATVLAHRRHVNKLRDLQVVVIGIKWEEHPFDKMDAMNLNAIQHVTVSDETDLALLAVADALRAAADNGAASTYEGSKTWFDAVHSKLVTYLTQFGREEHAKRAFVEASRELGVSDPNLPVGYFFEPTRRHYAAVAWRLVQGPLVAPEKWPPAGRPVPYWRRHLYQLGQILQFGGRIEETDDDLLLNLRSTWVGLQVANEIGHEIAEGTHVFHIHADITREADLDLDCLESDEPEQELTNTRRLLLDGLIFAGSWIWTGDAAKKPNVLHVSRICKLSRKCAVPRDLLVQTEHTDGIDDVLRRIKSCRRTGLPEEPVVVIDDVGVFYKDGYLNRQNLHIFKVATAPRKATDASPTLLFICSAGPPPLDAPPEDCHRIVISEEAWQAAFGLRREVQLYLGLDQPGSA